MVVVQVHIPIRWSLLSRMPRIAQAGVTLSLLLRTAAFRAAIAATLAVLAFTACGSSDSDAKQVKHSCTADPAIGGCTCGTFWNGPDQVPLTDCSPSKYPGTNCCADAYWPAFTPQGGETTCECRTDACAGAQVTVPSCRPEDAPSNPGPAGSAGSPGTTKCDGIGFCGPTQDACNCGSYCLHLGVGSYTCGYSCTSDSDCTSTVDPRTGSLYTGCSPSNGGYDGMCISTPH